MAKFGISKDKTRSNVKKGAKADVIVSAGNEGKDSKDESQLMETSSAASDSTDDGTQQKSSFELTDALIKQLRTSDSDPLLDLGVIDEMGSSIAGTYSMNALPLLGAITNLPVPAAFRPGEFTYASLSISDTPDGKCDRYFVMMTLGCVDGRAIGLEAAENTEQPYVYNAGISVRKYHDFDDKPVTYTVPTEFISSECAKLPQGVFEADGWDRIASVVSVGLHRTPDQFHIVLYNAMSRLITSAHEINEQLGRKTNAI